MLENKVRGPAGPPDLATSGPRGTSTMLQRNRFSQTRLMLLAGLLAGGAFLPAMGGEQAAPAGKPAAAAARTRYQPDRFAGRAAKYYQLLWGVDSPSVKLAESGAVVRFGYRVLDPDKARALNDKGNKPSLIDPRAGVALVVPKMEKIWQLRQTATPEAGKAYWMAFSNKGRPVKKGDRVDVVIGQFRAQGLVVD